MWKDVTWIWCNDAPQPDEYGEFVDSFLYDSGKVNVRISADSQYAMYVNGELAAWGQYADYPYDKVYDEVDITKYCCIGKNRVAFCVWYYGTERTYTYYKGKAALAYEITNKGKILCRSSCQTLARMSRTYRQHEEKLITAQLGFTFAYSAANYDNWINEEVEGFRPAVIVEQELPLRIRPCDKLRLFSPVVGVCCKRLSDTEAIYDLGKEQVGFLNLECWSEGEQEILISYGEHMLGGEVSRIIGNRNFSVMYRAKVGDNQYMNPFRRLGARYLQVKSEVPLHNLKISIVPTMYMLEEKERPALTPEQERIYSMCVETLRLCAHEHYEDCPWREQALYAMDSRNQMLCGYYAFCEYRFPKANLQLISRDNRRDGLLSICYPTSRDRTIPSFSLHYITACQEYLQHSGDKEFLEEIYEKLTSILSVFTMKKKNGLLPPFEADAHWNFYEWTDNLASGIDTDRRTPDLYLNTLYSYALQKMASIAEALGKKNTYLEEGKELNATIAEKFWSKEAGMFSVRPGDAAGYSQLGNALAILCGAADQIPGASESIADKLCGNTQEQMIEVSLSMVCFKYDALLKVNRKKYAPVILEDIRKAYEKMIEFGSSTVWETAEGAKDFNGAGSLCHGWSAMPIYYYHQILSELYDDNIVLL